MKVNRKFAPTRVLYYAKCLNYIRFIYLSVYYYS